MKVNVRKILLAANIALLFFTVGAIVKPDLLSATKARYMCCQVDTEGRPYCCMSCGFLQCANKPVCANDEHCGGVIQVP